MELTRRAIKARLSTFEEPEKAPQDIKVKREYPDFEFAPPEKEKVAFDPSRIKFNSIPKNFSKMSKAQANAEQAKIIAEIIMSLIAS